MAVNRLTPASGNCAVYSYSRPSASSQSPHTSQSPSLCSPRHGLWVLVESKGVGMETIQFWVLGKEFNLSYHNRDL